MQYEANHPIVGDSTIVCDTKYYTAVSFAHCLVAGTFLLFMKTHVLMLILPLIAMRVLRLRTAPL